jgi:hypothetical protein
LEKGIDCGWLIALPGGPRANLAECGEQAIVGFQKEVISAISSPICKRIAARQKFVANPLNTEDIVRGVVLDQPIPEGGEKSRP